MYNLLLHSQFRSPLMWDVIVISTYMLVNLVYLYYMTRREPPQAKLKIVSRVALPVAILVHSVTAWVFGLQIARAGWHSALMAPLFVASALDSGLALLLVALLLLRRFGGYPIADHLVTSLAGLMVTCCCVDGYFVFSEMLTMYYPQDPGGQLIFWEMVSGSSAPFFWGEVILGFVLPIGILLFQRNREKASLVFFSSVLIFMGVLCKRLWLLFTSFLHPNVAGAPGVTLGKLGTEAGPLQMWDIQGHYFPTLVEFTIVIGMIAMGVLIFSVLSRLLLLSPQAAEVGTKAQPAKSNSKSLLAEKS